MKMRLWKKLAVAVMAGGVLLAPPVVHAEAVMTSYGTDKIYCPEPGNMWNTSMPFILGEQKFSREYPEINTKLTSSCQSISTMDKLLWQTRPEIMGALAGFEEKQRTAAEAALAELEDKAENLRAMGNTAQQDLWISRNVTVQRSDLRAVSLLCREESMTGGARPMGKVQGTTYDTLSGKELSIMDVCNDVPILLHNAKELLVRKYNHITPEFKDDVLEKLVANDGQGVTWILGYQGITIYFNPEEIASEVYGTLSVTVPFRRDLSLFNDYFINVPNEYLINFGHEIDYSIGNDDTTRKISVGWINNEGGPGVFPVIVVGDNIYKEEQFDCQTVKPMLVKTAGALMLYLDMQFGDYHTLAVYDISGGTVKYLDAMYMTQPAHYGVAGPGIDYTDLLTRPDEMRLEKQINPFMTCRGHRTYCVTDSGLPQFANSPSGKRYDIVGRCSVRLKKDYAADVIDIKQPDHPVIGKETLKAGTLLIGNSTDDETYVDFFVLSNNRYYRIKANLNDWPHTVNGERDTDVFEGVSYST